MDNESFRYLDSLPILEELITSSQSSDDKLRFKFYLNLSFNSKQALTRLIDLNNSLLEEMSAHSLKSLNAISLTVESYLTTLLSITTIGSIDYKSLTEHYCRRKVMVENHKILPSERYLQEITFTGTKTWGTEYGTLGYFYHLYEEILEYASPSQLVKWCGDSLLAQFKIDYDSRSGYTPDGIESKIIRELVNSFKGDMLRDGLEADVNLYLKHIDFIKAVEPISEIYKQLDFIEVWIPQVLNWYLSSYIEGGEPLPPIKNTSNKDAYKTLIEVAELCLANGLDNGSFDKLSYKFIHQSIEPIFFSFMEDLITIRKRNAYSIQTANSLESLLVQELFNNISINNNNNDIRKASQLILETIAPPGGYNLLLVLSSAALLNRAHILSHSSNLEMESLKKLDFNSDLELLGRIMRLLFLAGNCLRKSNLSHLVTLGDNIITITGLESSKGALYNLIERENNNNV